MLKIRRIIAILSIITLVFVLSSNSFALGGDANQDGSVTSADITCVILAIFGLPCAMPDCNGDGMVTSADITCVMLEIFGQGPTGGDLGPGDHTFSIQFDGRTRSYDVHVGSAQIFLES